MEKILADNPKEGAVWLIGMLLLLTQDTEEFISFALRVVFKEGVITFDDFARKDKKTMGMMIRDLQKHFHLDPSFEQLLCGFLEQRNIFVHSLRHQDWFDLESEPSLNRVWNFLKAYQENLEQVTATFVAFGLRFAEDHQVPMNEEKRLMEESGFLKYLKEGYYPLLNKALKRKAAKP